FQTIPLTFSWSSCARHILCKSVPTTQSGFAPTSLRWVRQKNNLGVCRPGYVTRRGDGLRSPASQKRKELLHGNGYGNSPPEETFARRRKINVGGKAHAIAHAHARSGMASLRQDHLHRQAAGIWR